MKKSILLIAPLTFLLSCSQTSEIFDDAYDEAKAPPKVNLDDQAGYADYIKNQEDVYDVEVDTNRYDNKSLEGNPSYYGPGVNQYSLNDGTNNRPYDYYGTNPNVCYHQNGNTYNYASNYCQYGCMTYNSYGNCWHTNHAGNPNYGWGINGSVVYGTSDPHNPYQNCANNGYYGNNYYGNGYGNNYYGNGYGYGNNYYGNGYGNSYYGNSYFGNGYGSNYYGNGYGNSYYGGYNNYNNGGMLGYGWWGNGSNNVMAGGAETTGSTNHHSGHRGGASNGGNSGNTTVYEHTVKGAEVTSTPFPAYAENQGHSSAYNQGVTKPTTGAPVGNGTTIVKKESVFSKPVTTGAETTYTATKTENASSAIAKGKPANNQFSTGNASRSNNSTNSGYTTGSYSRNTATNASGNTTSTGNNSYANPNKYGNRTTSTPAQTYTQTTNSSSNSSGRSNPSRNSTYSGNRSTNSGSSNSSGSGTRTTNTSSSGSRGGSTSSGTTGRKR